MLQWLRRSMRGLYVPLSLAAIIALALALQGHRSVLRRHQVRDEAIRHQLVRLAAKDRLVGSRLPDVTLLDTAGTAFRLRAHTGGRVVWAVDVAECAGCLETLLADWHRLVRRVDIEGLLVLGGVDPASGMGVVRGAGVRAPLAFDPDGRLAQALGVTAPFIVFVNDERNVVLSVDAGLYGHGDRRCGRGPFHRIEVIYGRGIPVALSPKRTKEETDESNG